MLLSVARTTFKLIKFVSTCVLDRGEPITVAPVPAVDRVLSVVAKLIIYLLANCDSPSNRH